MNVLKQQKKIIVVHQSSLMHISNSSKLKWHDDWYDILTNITLKEVQLQDTTKTVDYIYS